MNVTCVQGCGLAARNKVDSYWRTCLTKDTISSSLSPFTYTVQSKGAWGIPAVKLSYMPRNSYSNVFIPDLMHELPIMTRLSVRSFLGLRVGSSLFFTFLHLTFFTLFLVAFIFLVDSVELVATPETDADGDEFGAEEGAGSGAGAGAVTFRGEGVGVSSSNCEDLPENDSTSIYEEDTWLLVNLRKLVMPPLPFDSFSSPWSVETYSYRCMCQWATLITSLIIHD